MFWVHYGALGANNPIMLQQCVEERSHYVRKVQEGLVEGVYGWDTESTVCQLWGCQCSWGSELACERDRLKLSVLVGQNFSYDETIKRVEGSPRAREPPSELVWKKKDPERMSFSKVGYVAFITMVMNCTALVEWKSQKGRVVVAAAEKYLGVRF